VDENAAVVIQGSQLEVIGGSGAILVDLGEATSDDTLPAFNLRGAQLSYLDHGDRHDLATGQTMPAAHKLTAPCIDPAAPGFMPKKVSQRYFLDMLGDACLLEAMTHLLDGPGAEVRGLAYRVNPAPDELLPDIGFEFRLHRGPGLMGWCGAGLGGGDCTVVNARLDVIPVRMANPLFTPLAAGDPA
jgi:cyanophycinase